MIKGAEELRDRIRTALYLRALVRGLTFGLPVCGVAVLVVRLLAPDVTLSVLLGGMGILLFVLCGVMCCLAHGKVPSYSQCVAEVDAASGAGGAMMTEDAAKTAGWGVAPRKQIVPEVSYTPGYALIPLLIVLAFAIVALALPKSLFAKVAANSQEDGLKALLQQEAERLELYKEHEIVEEEKAEQIETWLDEAMKNADLSAGEMLEILDQVAEELDSAAEEAATTADETQNAALAAEELAERLQDALASNALNPADLEAAAETMREFLQNSSLPSNMLSNMLSAASGETLSSEMLANLSSQLSQCCSLSSNRLASLSQADIMKLSQCSGGCCTNGAAALASLLSQSSDCSDSAAALAGLCTGNGGIGKGYAPAEMSYKDPASTDGTASKEMSLGQGRISGKDDMRLVSLFATAPKVDDGKAQTDSGKLGNGAGEAGNARTPVVLPRHREAVKRYFGGEK